MENEQDKQYHAECSAAASEAIASKRDIQKNCRHKAKDGHTHLVYVKTGMDEYALCQKNQCKIRYGKAPEGYTGPDIYNEPLFLEVYEQHLESMSSRETAVPENKVLTFLKSTWNHVKGAFVYTEVDMEKMSLDELRALATSSRWKMFRRA